MTATCTFNYLEQQWAKCLAVRYLEEPKLFHNKLPKYFNKSECKLLMELLKCYIMVVSVFWPLKPNIENLKTCLNNMHPSIKFTFENSEIIYQNDKKEQVLNSLDVQKKKEILHEDNSVETDIYYKQRNTHDYLPNNIACSDHTKNNIP